MTCNGIMLVIYCLESSVFSAGAWTQEISGISDEQEQTRRKEQRKFSGRSWCQVNLMNIELLNNYIHERTFLQ